MRLSLLVIFSVVISCDYNGAGIEKPKGLVSVYCKLRVSNQSNSEVFLVSYPNNKKESPTWEKVDKGWYNFIFSSQECEGRTSLEKNESYLVTVVSPSLQKRIGEIQVTEDSFLKYTLWIYQDKLELKKR